MQSSLKRLITAGLCTAALAFGTWSLGHVSGAMHIGDAGDAALAPEFFAPSRMAELRTEPAADEVAALDASADDAATLAPLVPAAAVRLDAPGALAAVDEWVSQSLSKGGTELGSPGVVGRTVDALLGIRL